MSACSTSANFIVRLGMVGVCAKRFEPNRTLATQPKLDGHDERQINSVMKSAKALEILRRRTC
jgi:hypothetical protein